MTKFPNEEQSKNIELANRVLNKPMFRFESKGMDDKQKLAYDLGKEDGRIEQNNANKDTAFRLRNNCEFLATNLEAALKLIVKIRATSVVNYDLATEIMDLVDHSTGVLRNYKKIKNI